MTHLQRPLAILLALASCAAQAGSSVASSASTSLTTSLGSVSTSLQSVSNSSTQGGAQAAAGHYRVLEVAQLPAEGDQPARVQARLQALADPHDAGAEPASREWLLSLPQAAAAQGRLAVGRVVTAHARPYGLVFARHAHDGGEAFYLVLDDVWHHALRARPV